MSGGVSMTAGEIRRMLRTNIREPFQIEVHGVHPWIVSDNAAVRCTLGGPVERATREWVVLEGKGPLRWQRGRPTLDPTGEFVSDVWRELVDRGGHVLWERRRDDTHTHYDCMTGRVVIPHAAEDFLRIVEPSDFMWDAGRLVALDWYGYVTGWVVV